MLLVLGFGAACALAEPGESGSLDGRLTDLYSHPLAAVTVTLRNPQTGAATQALTNRAGVYHFQHLAPGTYTLEVDGAGEGAGRVDGIVIAEGYAAHVQTAVALGTPPAPVDSRPPRSELSVSASSRRPRRPSRDRRCWRERSHFWSLKFCRQHLRPELWVQHGARPL